MKADRLRAGKRSPFVPFQDGSVGLTPKRLMNAVAGIDDRAVWGKTGGRRGEVLETMLALVAETGAGRTGKFRGDPPAGPMAKDDSRKGGGRRKKKLQNNGGQAKNNPPPLCLSSGSHGPMINFAPFGGQDAGGRCQGNVNLSAFLFI